MVDVYEYLLNTMFIFAGKKRKGVPEGDESEEGGPKRVCGTEREPQRDGVPESANEIERGV